MGQLYGKKKAKQPNSAAKTKKPSLLQKLAKNKAQKSKTASGEKPKKKGFFKKVLNTVNRVNPATVLLRNGVLAAMKLNVKNVAGRLRWSYLTPEQAAGKGIDPQKFQRLVATREKLEKIFYGAGGNPKNLKKAMLGGKGNKDKAVAGLDGLQGISFSGIEYLNADTPLPQLLGPDIYRSENVDDMQGFAGLGQLGEPVTLASVGAAMGVLAGIVASLKQIGNIFTNKGEGSKDFDEATNEAAENNQAVPNTTPIPEGEAKMAAKEAMNNAQATASADDTKLLPASGSNALVKSEGTDDEGSNAVVSTNEANTGEEVSNAVVRQSNEITQTSKVTTNTNDKPPTEESFWDKNKSWLKPVAIGVGGIGLIAIGLSVMKPKVSGNSNRTQQGKSLSGLPSAKRKKEKHYQRKPKAGKPKRKHHTKKAVALL